MTEVAAPDERMSDVTLYAPDGDGSWPVTVLFSGWNSAHSTLDPLARALAAEGVVVATADSGAADGILAGEYECSQRLAILSAGNFGGDPTAPVAVGGREVVAAIVRALSDESSSGPDQHASGPAGVETICDLEYLSTGSERFLVDVYRPDSDGPFPVIVLFHAGDPSGKDGVATVSRAQALASAGLVVFAPTWNTDFTAPTSQVLLRSLDRAACALAFAERHAPVHDGDADAVATFGGSAGAQPAA